MKNGLILPATVSVRLYLSLYAHVLTVEQAGTFTAQEVVTKRLHEDAMSGLEDLMNQIFARRAEAVPAIPSVSIHITTFMHVFTFVDLGRPSSFRMPPRVTLNDAKRQAWFADLANPDVPLSKLGKSVPHGAKGQDLLDLLHVNNVAIPRAIWFLRVFGANETVSKLVIVHLLWDLIFLKTRAYPR